MAQLIYGGTRYNLSDSVDSVKEMIEQGLDSGKAQWLELWAPDGSGRHFALITPGVPITVIA